MAVPAPTGSRWCITPGQHLRFRQYDDQFVLFNDLSGDTHLLGDAAMHVLGVLQHGPATAPALLASLAQGLACAPDAQLEAEADALLASLAGYYLIECLPC